MAVNDVAQMDILVGKLRHCWMDRTLLSAWHHVLHLPPQPDPHLTRGAHACSP
jgi:hypothetical protein